eukprot:gene21767-1248_t
MNDLRLTRPDGMAGNLDISLHSNDTWLPGAQLHIIGTPVDYDVDFPQRYFKTSLTNETYLGTITVQLLDAQNSIVPRDGPPHNLGPNDTDTSPRTRTADRESDWAHAEEITHVTSPHAICWMHPTFPH